MGEKTIVGGVTSLKQRTIVASRHKGYRTIIAILVIAVMPVLVSCIHTMYLELIANLEFITMSRAEQERISFIYEKPE